MTAKVNPSSAVAPAEVSISAVERSVLGGLVSFHPPASRTHLINISIAGGFAVVLLSVAAAIGVNAVTGEPGRGLEGAALFFGGLGILPAIGAAFLARKLFWKLFLFQNGFVLARGSKPEVVLWDDVAVLWMGGLNIDKHLDFQRRNQTRVRVDNSFSNYGEFAGTAREEVARRIIAQSQATLAKKEAVSFGKLALHFAGLEHAGKNLSWASVSRLAIEDRVNGNVIFNALAVWTKPTRPQTEEGEWALIPVSELPNFDAFVTLAERLSKLTIDRSL